MALRPEQIEALSAPMPKEALAADRSRGFELTTVKAAYIIERLNEVLGLVGTGWRYAHSPTTREDKEILLEVVLQYAVDDGCPPMAWSRTENDWIFREHLPAVWSEPITAYGGNPVGGGGSPVLDAMKSAVTAGITKAASRLGVALQVHKGLRREGSDPRPETTRPSPGGNGSNPPAATRLDWDSYWTTFSEDEIKESWLEQAGATVLAFGKHAGKTLLQIDGEERSYVRWLSEPFDPQDSPTKIKLKNAAIYFRACRKFQDEGASNQPGNPGTDFGL